MTTDNGLCDKPCRVEIFLGHEIEDPTELRLVRRVRSDLEAIGEPALILGNFYCGPLRTQIDVVVVTSRGATVVEVKGYRLPVEGGVNGQWVSLFPNGKRRAIASKNPFQQALDARHAVADELSKIASVDSGRARQAVGGNLCLFPEPLAGSSIPDSNFKCTVGSYRELLSQINESRTGALPLETWREFASRIGLVRQAPENRGAWERFAAEYSSQWQTAFAATSKPFVPLPLLIEGHETLLADCARRLSEGRNLVLVGASGSGKSRVLEELSTLVAAAGLLPITVEARLFDGNLRPLLERSVTLATRFSLAEVFRCARRSEHGAVVLVDGFNECPIAHQKTLLRALFAMYQRYGVQLVVTSQSEVPVPWLPGDLATVPDPTRLHLGAVLESHLGRATRQSEQDALEVAATAHDAELLASVIGERGLDSRFSLYGAFTRLRLGPSSPAAHSALASVAGRMHERFLSSVSEHEVLRELTSVADSSVAAAQVWDLARQSGLMVLRSGRAFFRHDLIADYFATVSLLTRCPDTDGIVRALERPINAPLAEFMVGACETLFELGVVLHTASVELLVACIEGKCGSKARSFVLDQVRDALEEVAADYQRLILELDTDERGRHHVSARLPDDVEADSNGNYLAVVSYALDHGLLPDVLRAFGTIDRAIRTKAEQLRAYYPDVKVAFRRRAYNAIYGPTASVRAMHDIQQGFSLLHRQRSSGALQVALWEQLSRADELFPGQLLIIAGAINRLAPLPQAIPGNFATVLQQLWDVGIQRLRLEVVELARRIGPHLNVETEQELRATLESWLSDDDPFTNTLVFDALQGVGGPETSLSVEVAHEELLAALQMTPSGLASERAMHLYVCTFDHPCDSLYWEAFYERLTDRERLEILLRAADATYSDLTTSMVVAELARNPVPAAVACFRRFAQMPHLSGTWTQAAVETYLRSIAALAGMGVDLDPGEGDAPAMSAWYHAARLLHLLAGRPEALDSARLAMLWGQLERCGVAHAFDVVMHVETSDMFRGSDMRLSFLPGCSEGVRRLARDVLRSSYQPATEFERSGQWRGLMSEHRIFALQVLAHIGRKTDLELVKAWTEDTSVGRHAIAAAKSLETHTGGNDTDNAR
ncbi:NERD domain-containing protein [Trinickia mobilis]|uniref:NERD domain-containing protein n=1 Tax=Trinickia mobilis TaxID=2816356 RepID=UPI001A8C77C1|nr:NERD domain-containing protein [Trinickia mobilis]